MPDKKLTDSEIAKALEEWIKNYDGSYVNFKKLGNALDLINRLEARIGIYETCNARKDEAIKHLESEVKRLQAEIERLKDALTDHEYANCVAIKNGLIYTHTLEDYDRLIGDISAEAYKECIEKVKAENYDRCIDVVYDGSGEVKRTEIRQALFNKQLDNLLKELVGEDDA